MNHHSLLQTHQTQIPSHRFLPFPQILQGPQKISYLKLKGSQKPGLRKNKQKQISLAISASTSPLDLSEENIKTVLDDARTELSQLFDSSVGITGKAELAELDGPYVKISLKGRFWHERSLVLARLGNYLKQRIPEILEVDIEDEKQLDDSPANF